MTGHFNAHPMSRLNGPSREIATRLPLDRRKSLVISKVSKTLRSKLGERTVLTQANERFASGDTSRLIHVNIEDECREAVIPYHDDGASLTDYIALPVSQYVLIDLPLGGKLERIGSEAFEISVPKLDLAGIWVRPIVKCLVRNDAGFVDIVSTDLHIETSSHMEFLRLNDCVEFSVKCQLRPVTVGSTFEINCSSQIKATVAPPLFFNYIPAFVLESTANMGLKTALSTLQGTFLRSLVKDYERWATSSGYREERKQHAEESDQQILTSY